MVYKIKNPIAYSESKQKFNKQTRLIIAEKYKTGKTSKQLGCEYKCTGATILNVLKRLNVQKRNRLDYRLRHYSIETEQKVIEDYKNDISPVKLKNKYGLSFMQLRLLFQMYGIERPKYNSPKDYSKVPKELRKKMYYYTYNHSSKNKANQKRWNKTWKARQSKSSYKLKRRALGKISRETYKQMMEVYSGLCGYCGEKMSWKESTLDHIVPVFKGGNHKYNNLVWSCMNCNCSKNSRNLIFWLADKLPINKEVLCLH